MQNVQKKKKIIILVVIAVWLLFSAAALFFWVADTVNFGKNTFTVGNVEITLTQSLQVPDLMMPGNDEIKDPKITVKAGSDACWLFFEVDEGSGIEDYITYAAAEGWEALEGYEDVYYRQTEKTDADLEYSLLVDNTVTVNNVVVEEQLTTLMAFPDVTFKAYAVAQSDAEDALGAWAQALASAAE